ncbi:family A1 protease [Mycena vulgaris]|nr:family A1 protease [Mycena vulgaris]
MVSSSLLHTVLLAWSSTPNHHASVLVGSPGTTYNLIVDTGSANTWIGAAQPYNQTSTRSQKSTSPSKTGILFLDQISIPGVGVMPNTTIGVAQASNGFKGVDGVLGMGPDELSRGTVGPDPTEMLPAIVQTLFCQGNIPAEVFSIFMQPTGSVSAIVKGEISWGASTTDLTHLRPMTTHFPASAYWGVDMQFSYGSTSILRQTAGIIDTGSTLIYLAHGAYLLYESLTKARLDPSTGLLTVPSMSNLQNLIVKMGGRQFPLIPNAQIWPRMLNTAIRGQSNQIYLVVADLGTEEGAGLDFVLGMVFLQRYYSAYDYDNGLIGLSETAFTGAISN